MSQCLEAEFYSWVAYGKGIASIDSTLSDGTNLTATSSGGTTGSSSFSAATLAYATDVAENEINHVRFLRSALGSLAVKCPSLSLSPATFTVAAKAAVSNYGKLISGRNNAGKEPFSLLKTLQVQPSIRALALPPLTLTQWRITFGWLLLYLKM